MRRLLGFVCLVLTGLFASTLGVQAVELVWLPTTPLQSLRVGPGVTVGNDGLIYAIAGGTGTTTGSAIDTVERFDEVAQTWEYVEHGLAQKRMQCGAVTDSFGRIWAVGGVDGDLVLDSVERRDQGTGVWTTMSSHLNTGRVGHGTAIAQDDSIYVFGGWEEPTPAGNLDSAEKYDPITDTWTFVASMNEARWNLAYATDREGRIYAIGGTTWGGSPTRTVERYDPSSDVWEYVTDQPQALCSSTAFTVNGEIYVVGGWHNGYTNACFIYSPETNTWREGPAMYERVGLCPAALGPSGTVYLVGGQGPAIQARDRVAMLVRRVEPQPTIIWVSGDRQALKAYDVSGDLVDEIPFAAGDPDGLSFSGGFLWYVNGDEGLIYKIDLATKSVVASLPTGGGTQDVELVGDVLYAVDFRANVLRKLDPDTGEAIGDPIALSDFACALSMTYADGFLWIVDYWTEVPGQHTRLGRLDLSTGELVGELIDLPWAKLADIDWDGRFFYGANDDWQEEAPQDILIIDPEDFSSPIGNIPTDVQDPQGIALVPCVPPVVTELAINGGEELTENRTVTLNNATENSPRHYMASEDPEFEGATWQPYSTAPEFTLSEGDGEKTVYFKTNNEAGESDVVSDSIVLHTTALLFEDGFENFSVGEYPGGNGWQTMFSGDTAYVTGEEAAQGEHSFKLVGRRGWSRTDYITLEYPDFVFYEARVMIAPGSAGACVGMVTKVSGGMNIQPNSFWLEVDSGRISWNQQEIPDQGCEAGRWYRVAVAIDFNTLKADVYVDGELKLHDAAVTPRTFHHETWGDVTLNTFALHTPSRAATTAYFDDDRILAELPESPWEVVYSTDFSTDPQWVTDQPDNYYWNEAWGTYRVRAENNAPDYQPNRYFYRALQWADADFKLTWEIRVTKADWSAGIDFGLWDENLISCGTGGGQSIYLDFSRVDAGRVFGAYVFGSGGQAVDWTAYSYSSDLWYRCRISYDAAGRKVSFEVTERESGSQVWATALNVPGEFTSPLINVGGSRTGLHEPYSGVNQGAVAEAEIDNVVLRRAAAEPGLPVVTHIATHQTTGQVGGIHLSPDDSKLYVAYWEWPPAPVEVLSLPGFELHQTMSYGRDHRDVVASADGRYLFTDTYYEATVSRFDLESGAARTDLGAGDSWPMGIGITRDRKKVLVMVGRDGRSYDMNNDGISIFDIQGDNFAHLATVRLNDEPHGRNFGISQDNRFAYVVTHPRKSPSPKLYEISLEAPYEVTRTLDFSTSQLSDAACAGDTVLVSDHTNSKIWLVDRASLSVQSEIALDAQPGTLAVHPDGRHVFVLFPEAQEMAVIDLTSRAVVASLGGVDAAGPADIEVSSDGSRAYVVAWGGLKIQVFSYEPAPELPVVTQFAINNGQESTEDRTVTLNNATENDPRHYMASEDPEFEGATWQPYSTAPEFTLSGGNGEKTVYFKTNNEAGESDIATDSITLQERLWQAVYETGFSTDPGWTTNDSANLFWDAETESFHGWQANTNTSYAYRPVGLRSNASFRLEFDVRINSVGWSAGLTFGLFDERLMYNAGAVVDYSLVDAGYVTALYAGNPSGPPDWEVSNWESGVWYRNVIEYDTTSQVIRFEARRRDDGALLSELTLSGIRSFPTGMRLLGVSRVHMEGYNYNAVDFNLDNIVLREHYEPPRRPVEILPLSGPLLRIGWDSEEESEYQLWATPDLSSGEWFAAGPRMGGTGERLYLDDYVEGIERRFYRVEIISPIGGD